MKMNNVVCLKCQDPQQHPQSQRMFIEEPSRCPHMEYDEGSTDITLRAKLDPVISLIVTLETGMHTIDKNMELLYSAHLVQKTSPCLVPIAHMCILISLQSINAHSARANLPLSAG